MEQVQSLRMNGHDRFEKYGENVMPPSQDERGEGHAGYHDG